VYVNISTDNINNCTVVFRLAEVLIFSRFAYLFKSHYSLFEIIIFQSTYKNNNNDNAQTARKYRRILFKKTQRIIYLLLLLFFFIVIITCVLNLFDKFLYYLLL